MKLGLSTYTMTWSIGVPGYEPPADPLTADGLIRLAHECGLELVQIADNIPLHLMSEEELRSLRATADDLGVTIEIGTRGTNPEHLLLYLQIARKLRSGLVRTIITIPDADQACAELQQVLPAFAEAGITLAVENHGLQTTGQLVQLFQKLDSPFVGSCLDTVNSFGALEGPALVIERLMPYLVNLHIKDFDIQRVDHQMGFVILGTPAGEGRLDLPDLVKKARQRGRDVNAILELWTPYTGSVEQTIALEHEWLKKSLDNLRKLDF